MWFRFISDRVYQELLDWHEAFYRKQRVTSARFLQKVSDVQGNPEYRLSFAERKRILLDHVFGVDIDPQAVEVTKLSLFLKLINDTSVMPKQLELAEFKRRLLPDMNRNIVCGNSIVARDVTETVSMSADELEDFKPMNWHGPEAFEGVVKSGGFDVIIGNPPYSYRKSTIEKFKSYYSSNYATTEGNFDIYKMFLERAVKLLKPKGALSQIVNSSFLIQPQFKKLRRFLVRHLRLAEIAVLGPNVFKGVTIDTAIMSARKGRSDARHMISIKEPVHPSMLAAARPHEVPQARFASNEEGVFDWRVTQASGPILDRIFSAFSPMERYCEFSVGINTGSMKAEMTSSRRKNRSYHPCVPGNGLTRYGEIRTDGWIAYDPKLVKAAGNRGRSLPPERFFTSKKILVVRTRNTSLKRRIVATVDANCLYNLNRLSNIIARQGTDLYTMMGVLNSELVGFIFLTRFFNYEIKPVYLKKLPIPLASHPDISKWVKERLQLSSQLMGAMNPTRRRALEARQRDLESWIDAKVYEVYGLASAAVKTIQREMADLPGA